jgi:signal peptidase I
MAPEENAAEDDLGSALAAVDAPPRSHRRRSAPTRDGDADATTRAELRARRRRRVRRTQFGLLFGLLALMVLVRALFLQAFYIPSPSMENTLHVGDRVLVNKMSYRVGDVRRGQIVVFDGVDSFDRAPTKGRSILDRVLGLVGAAPSEDDYIKRVIGLPGDRVRCCDAQGRLQVNTQSLDEPYLYPLDLPSRDRFDVVVPPGRLWVMGDHRSRSADSRSHLGDPGGGTVPLDKVVGRAVAVVWPLKRAGWLSVPHSFEGLTNGRATGD